MSRNYVSSSNLRSVGYDPGSAVLQIEFHHGGIYNYYQVPWSVYAGLMEAGSKGRYHHEHIKRSYPYRRVN
jgi:hypothetical protein